MLCWHDPRDMVSEQRPKTWPRFDPSVPVLGFWVRVDGGHVMVTRQRITREPVKDGDEWKQEVLYTNDAEWPDALK